MKFTTKNFIALIVVTLCVSSFLIVRNLKKQIAKPAYTIGILQTASHPALDAVRDGFIEQMHKQLNAKVEFVVKNAQGSVASAHAIAEQLHSDKNIDGILAIATPAAQAISTIEKIKPIFIAAVTDPEALGLTEQNNVSGASDMINVKSEIDMLTQLLPKVKTVSLLFSNAEVNSITLAKQMRAALSARGLKTIDFAVSNESEIPTAADWAFLKGDVVLSPTDNNVASTIELISQLSKKYKKPFIASDNLLVKQGALAARGIDYKENGRQAAQVAYAILIEKQKPSDVKIMTQKNSKIYVNNGLIKSLGLSISALLQEDVIPVE